jgi:hypothetical protein
LQTNPKNKEFIEYKKLITKEKWDYGKI